MSDEMNGPNFEGDIRYGSVWRHGRWHQMFPRHAVLGDICDWADSRPVIAEIVKERTRKWYRDFAFVDGDQRPPSVVTSQDAFEAGAVNILEESDGHAIDVNYPPRYKFTGQGPEPIRRMSFGEWARSIRTVKLMELNKRMSDRLLEADASNLTKQDKINALQDIEVEHQKLNGELREQLEVAEEERDTARARVRQCLCLCLLEVERLTKELKEMTAFAEAVNGEYIELQALRLK